MRWLAVPLVAVIVLVGCGDDGTSDEGTFTTGAVPEPTVVSEPDGVESGPMVRICDRRLAERVGEVLGEEGFEGRFARPEASGSDRLSQCTAPAEGAEVQFPIDAGQDAPRRFRNRIAEQSQFSGGEPEDAPQTVKGVGAASLAAAGASWIGNVNELLSVRGDRVLIASVSARGVRNPGLKAAAVALSLYVYERLATR